MAKLIELSDAANLLGIGSDELNTLRTRGKIYAYRDGGTWKFKMEEIERYAADAGIDLNSVRPGAVPQTTGGSGIDADLDDLVDVSDLDDLELESSDSVLAGDETIQTEDEGGSTIVGTEDSDLQLVADLGEGSDVKLVSGGSDILSSGNDGDDDVSLDDDSLKLSDDELVLDDDEEMLLGADEGSAVDLDADSDDNLVLGSGVGSDVTLDPGDSGISLNPSDSGLSLEEPLELAGSGVESLELGEDDMISLEEEVDDPDAATQLKADDDFLLTAVDDEDEDADSGSQVIALDSEEFDESAGEMLGAAELLEAEADPLAGGESAELAAALAAAAPELPEAPYSIWNVLSLVIIILFLGVAGMMVTDLLRNMWSWDEAYTANSVIMDKIVEMIDKK